jgi:cell division protein FtsI/penicillin-binding protein 2
MSVTKEEIDRIKEIKDSEIDCSDIPELTIEDTVSWYYPPNSVSGYIKFADE